MNSSLPSKGATSTPTTATTATGFQFPTSFGPATSAPATKTRRISPPRKATAKGKGSKASSTTSKKLSKEAIIQSWLHAAYLGDVAFVEEVVSTEFDVDIQNRDGETALHSACVYGHPEIVKLLLDHGANVNVINKHGNCPLHQACHYGKLECVQLLVAKEEIDATLANENLETPLLKASGEEHEECTRVLLENKERLKIDIEAPSVTGNNPLLYACMKKSTAIARMLIDHGANVNFVNPKDGDTALIWACDTSSDFTDIVSLLLQRGGNVNAANHAGVTGLYFAVANKNLPIVRVLLEHGADVNVIPTTTKSALHMAAKDCSVEIAKLLIEHGADVNIADTNGHTPLIFAHSSLDISRMLLGRNADVNAADDKGNTALLFASTRESADVFKLLVEHKADVHVANKKGQTALLYASEFGNEIIVQILLDLQVDTDKATTEGVTSLMRACQHNFPNIVRLLLDYGASVHKADNNNKTAMDYASDESMRELLRTYAPSRYVLK